MIIINLLIVSQDGNFWDSYDSMLRGICYEKPAYTLFGALKELLPFLLILVL